nr:immunoglobulin light chain junction region [Macaca mulatta]MOY08987.1 immunoglobulin light chain junction region [Macaca mulatta]
EYFCWLHYDGAWVF